MPTYKVVANDADITAAIASRFISMNLTDETGLKSDLLEIVLDDSGEPIQRPPKGAELEVSLGYDGEAHPMGLFVVDEFEYLGWPSQLVIRARAAVFEKTPKGKEDLQSHKTRSWPTGTKLADMVAKIAKEHGMESAVAASLKSITLPHIDQSEESDLNLLVRLAKKYDAIVKPAGGKLVLAKRGESKTVSGQTLPTITLTPNDDISRFRVTETARESSGTVVAYYHLVKQAKRHEVKVGSGEPVYRIKQYFQNQDMALAAAKAELAKRDRKKSTLSITMPGRPDAAAECPLNLTGFRDGVDGEWIVTRVSHRLDKSSGYVCDLEAETPNEGGAAVEDDET